MSLKVISSSGLDVCYQVASICKSLATIAFEFLLASVNSLMPFNCRLLGE